MERILITGDTHGNLDNIITLMDNVEFDAVIHLGDYIKDAIQLEKIYPDIKFYKIKGNNDFSGESEKVITVGEHKIYFCHGHLLGVGSDLLRLSLKAEEKGADVALYGHTHTPEDTIVNSVRIFSPGSPSRPRMSENSVGILEWDDDYFEMAHYYFK